MFKSHKLFLILVLLPSLCLASGIKPYYDGTTIPATLLTPPIQPSSADGKNQIELVRQAQNTATDTDIEAARSEKKMWADILTLAVVPVLTRSDYPHTYRLLDRAGLTAKQANDFSKEHWQVIRPYLFDSNIKPLIDNPTNYAYPSGHTSGSFVWAHILGQLLPEYRTAFYAQAERIAMHRVMVGLHYPHDLEGGKELALLIMGGFLQNDNYQKDFKAAQMEITNKPPR